MGEATAREGLTGDTPDAGSATPADADGFSPDYGALVDDFQQQRALDPLVDE